MPALRYAKGNPCPTSPHPVLPNWLLTNSVMHTSEKRKPITFNGDEIFFHEKDFSQYAIILKGIWPSHLQRCNLQARKKQK
jgi:hypothetical protein